MRETAVHDVFHLLPAWINFNNLASQPFSALIFSFREETWCECQHRLDRKCRADWQVCGWPRWATDVVQAGKEVRGGGIAYQVGRLAFDDELLLLEVLYERRRSA